MRRRWHRFQRPCPLTVFLEAACWLSCLEVADGKVFEGVLPMTGNFAEFIGKFCYDYSPTRTPENVGILRIETIREEHKPDTSKSGKLFFLLYDDEPEHWRKVSRSWTTSTCSEKISASVYSLEVDLFSADQVKETKLDIQEHLRPRFWYFTFVACGLAPEHQLRYRIRALNTMWGFQREFSLDHLGMMTVYAIFALLYSLAMLLTVLVTKPRPHSREPSARDHPYIKLLMLSFGASSASCFLMLIHDMLFISDGYGSMRIRFLGVLAGVVANCTIFLIAILASVGWAVSTMILPDREMFLGMVAVIGAITLLCELHAEMANEASTKLYGYQSVPGMGAIITKIFMFCWFSYQCKTSFEAELEDRRRSFYKVLGVSMSAWALNVPIVVLLAFALDPWNRYKVVVTADILARFLGQALLLRLFCGPWSPISADNTFAGSDQLGMELPFGGFDDNSTCHYDDL